jgi:hypothetical protein
MEDEQEQDTLLQTRLFWVLLTIFGSMFATGLFVIFQTLGWGLFYTIAGLLGMLILVRDRVSVDVLKVARVLSFPRVPIRTPVLVLASAVISIFVGHTIAQIMAIQTAVTRYVLPRAVTEKQADALRDYLSHYEAHSVTVKADPLDGEAIQYAVQVYNAFRRTEWTVELSTSDKGPNTLNAGLCIGEQGTNAKRNDPRHDPRDLLQQAFQAAHIEVDCGSGSSAGEYKLFVLVGHRPLVMGSTEPEPTPVKLGHWIETLGQQ